MRKRALCWKYQQLEPRMASRVEAVDTELNQVEKLTKFCTRRRHQQFAYDVKDRHKNYLLELVNFYFVLLENELESSSARQCGAA
tara:strand:- start:2 stop:256 length:255 start_codon:yes stop_codon:yes gene_type:complete